jgi:glycosyltransferase involved in cell wall biosynthesis
MIWLASFPRSGNTFFRNILYEVYGIESSTYHQEKGYFLDPEYDRYPVVKTHLLPNQLKPADAIIPKVYLIRDGRDAVVSLAHHRKDIVEPGTDFEINLLEAILAADGSYFGGWSENVQQWIAVADIVIRYEDLIEDPIREVEKLRAVMDLPQPNISKLPSFTNLKFGRPRYGSGAHLGQEEAEVADLAKKNFRKGRSGTWREEMPKEYLALFYDLHGKTLKMMGYEADVPQKSEEVVRILFEGAKAMDKQMDGVRRYTEELLYGMHHLISLIPNRWQIDVLIGKDIVSLEHFITGMAERRKNNGKESVIGDTGDSLPYENRLMRFKNKIKSVLPAAVYGLVRWVYIQLPFRYILRQYRSMQVYRSIRKHVGSVSESYDLIHVPLPQNFKNVDRYRMKFVFTLHDMTHRTHPQFHVNSNVQLAEKGLSFIERQKAAVIAVSQHTMQDYLTLANYASQEVKVIYEAANHHHFNQASSKDEVQKRYGLEDRPYFLCLFTLEPRKNIVHTVQAFLQFCAQCPDNKYQLIIAGGKGWKDDFLEEIKSLYPNRVRFLGYVPDEDLPGLIKGAYVFCYLPHYEGFGLPALEAIQYGTPVLFSGCSSLPEVCGDAGLAANPASIEDIALQMVQITANESLYYKMKEAAFPQSRKFSWVKAGFETLNFYTTVAGR